MIHRTSGAHRPSTILHRTLLALTLLSGGALAQTRAPQERELWYAYHANGARYGSHRIEVVALPDGNTRYRISVRILFDLMDQQQQEMAIEGTYVVTPDLHPVSLDLETRQMSGSVVLTGRRKGEDAFTMALVDRAGGGQEADVPLDPADPFLFSVVLEDWLAGLDPNGEPASAKLLDEGAWEVQAITATCERHDATGSSWRLDVAEGHQVLRLDADGRLLETESGGEEGVDRVVRCTEEDARELAYLRLVGSDVLMFPIDRDLKAPHRLVRLVVDLSWKDIPLAAFDLEDARQRLVDSSETEKGGSARVEILAPPPINESVAFPVEDEAFAPYLAETEYVKPTDPLILAAAQEATADATNAVEAVEALSKWVADYVEDQMIIETLTGSEVLAAKRGKCTEHTMLFASMARAIGIPTRLVLGERMTEGNWGGHLWNEAWVGRWMTVDATANEVDRSFQLLKFVHSASLAGTTELRTALPKSLSISVADFALRESGVDDALATGIEGVTYTNVDYAARLSAPGDDWELVDSSQPAMVLVSFTPPKEKRVTINFVAFAVPVGQDPKGYMETRLAHWGKTFDEYQLLSSEKREVRGALGHAAQSLVRNDDAEESVVVDEVYWVKGQAGFLLSMSGVEEAYDQWAEGFGELVKSFVFLDE